MNGAHRIMWTIIILTAVGGVWALMLLIDQRHALPAWYGLLPGFMLATGSILLHLATMGEPDGRPMPVRA